MSRRQRSDSATAAVERFQAEHGVELQPPAHIHLPEPALPFWRAIIRARAREEWGASPSLLNAAANLAWTQYQIDQTRRQIDGEEDLPEGLVVAQLAGHLLKMQRLEMAYLRTLQQHGRAVEGEARDVAKRRSAAKADALPDDDLLATPN